jgi:hypothetical protein
MLYPLSYRGGAGANGGRKPLHSWLPATWTDCRGRLGIRVCFPQADSDADAAILVVRARPSGSYWAAGPSGGGLGCRRVATATVVAMRWHLHSGVPSCDVEEFLAEHGVVDELTSAICPDIVANRANHVPRSTTAIAPSRAVHPVDRRR